MRRTTSRRISALAAVALLVPLAAACGSDDKGAKDSGTAAEEKATGPLVIYSGRNEELIAPLLEKLEKATGTKVEVRYGDSAELAAQLLEEGDKTKADIFFSQDAGALGALAKAGRLDALPQGTLDRVDTKYRAEDGNWVGVSGRARVIAYNSDKVAKAPESVKDLTKPEWKGKVGYAPTNASFQAFVTGMRVLEGDDATRTWLKDFKANEPQVYEKNGAVLTAVDDGKAELGLINHYYWYEKAAEEGADKLKSALSFPKKGDPGALVNVAGVGVLKGNDQKAAAQKAVDFLLAEEAQTYFADETHEYPLAAGVTSKADLPELDTLGVPEIDLGKLESLEVTLEMLREAGMV
ncbi:iron ABC transporter substrate-binding protein [Streptomyces sp. ZEA17I]|uniref:iron ABC transporter substrate-binding protein n=1 Tax=Streptomyces sp. ZEA17I TaxID=2202516 RepID=UPI000D6EF965|nr:iron ABC transporter substrate-binding protein [Streptomyces sp. ZEA17I]PWS43309.1 iron ABC transporter substrate-binding protein [Streptomyces sp. ZEA17I]